MPVRDLKEDLGGSVQVRLAPSQEAYLDAVTETHNVTRSSLIRFAISLMIQHYGRKTDDLVEDVAAEIHDLRRRRSSRYPKGGPGG